MAQDLGQDFATHGSGTPTTVSGLGATIVAGATDDATEINFNSATAPLALDFEATIPTGTGTPDGNEQCNIYFRWGTTTGNPTDTTNTVHIETVSIPTASTTFRKSFRVPVLNAYLTITVENDQVAGPDITSSLTLKYREVYGNQV